MGWGLAPVATQFALRGLPAATVLALRFSIVSILLLPALRRPAHRFLAEDRIRLATAALLGVVGYNAAVTFGLRETNASTAGFLIAIEPVLILGLVRLGGHEPVARGRWAGALASVIGVAIIAFSSRTGAPGDPGSLAGTLLILVAATCFAAYVVAIRPLSIRHGAFAATTMTTLLGSLVLVAATLPEVDPGTLAHVAPGTFAAILSLALGSTILAMIFYNHAISVLGPGRGAGALNLLPVVTALGGLAFLGQPIPSSTLVGGAVIMVGVLAAARAAPRRP